MEIESDYLEAVVAFNHALACYEATKDRAYVMLAWSAWRKTNDLEPSYEGALLTRTGGVFVSPDGAKEREIRLFAAMGAVAADSAEPQLRSIQNVQAAKVIETMNVSLFNASMLLTRWQADETRRKDPPPVTEAHMRAMAAKAHGLSDSAVRKIWDEWLDQNGHLSEFREMLASLKAAAKTKKPKPKQPVQSAKHSFKQ